MAIPARSASARQGINKLHVDAKFRKCCLDFLASTCKFTSVKGGNRFVDCFQLFSASNIVALQFAFDLICDGNQLVLSLLAASNAL